MRRQLKLALAGLCLALQLHCERCEEAAAVQPGDDWAPQPSALDDSVRCRHSGICDGPPGSAQVYGLDADDPAALRDAQLARTACPAARAAAVRDAAQWAWQGYRDCAWGWDELRPLSCGGAHWLNLSVTLVDSLDTLWLLGLHDEFVEAAEWAVEHVAPSAPRRVSLFETTIRVLGGLLSAAHLCAAQHAALAGKLLDLAAELGARLLPGFGGPAGLPYSDVDLATGEAAMPHWGNVTSLSEAGSLSLEFTLLARLTGHAEFEAAATAVHSALGARVREHGGLLPILMATAPGRKMARETISIGARGDSYYEYLLKQWVMTGKSDPRLLERYVQAMQAVRGRLLRSTGGPAGLWYVAEQDDGRLSPKMDHLVCFLPGLLALGAWHGVSTQRWEGDLPDRQLAARLGGTCYELYRQSPSGLAPEIAHFPNDTDFPNRHSPDIGHGVFYIKDEDAHSLLRPEAVESIYLLWKTTGDATYREWGWQVFRALERWARVPPTEQCVVPGAGDPPGRARGGGYASLESVTALPPPRRDRMESFFLAETLKYLYLLFTQPAQPCTSDGGCAAAPAQAAGDRGHEAGEREGGVLPLSLAEWVFNTEAHVFPVVGPAGASLVAPAGVDPRRLAPYRVQ